MSAPAYQGALKEGLAPEPALTVSEWADQFRYLSPKASAEPWRWRTSRTPYLREIMDALSPSSAARKVVLIGGAQIGKTECGNNWIGYVVHRCPAPMLMVQPTQDTAKKVSKQRIGPMIEATPVLRSRVREARERDSGNTTFVKEFPGGLLLLAGANSSAGLRSMPVRFLFCDEVDAYPGDVSGEGDPVALAEKRTSTFPRSKVLLTSTPTIRGLSRIESEWLKTDQRRYFIPCPACGHMDWLQWSAGGWRGNEGIHHHIVFDEHDASTARMKCAVCPAETPERQKIAMLRDGEWRPTANAPARSVGFHLSGLYSPLGWFSWEDCVREFLDSKDDQFKLKTWVNTRLAETWEAVGDSIEPDALRARASEEYGAEVPDRVGALIASIDVQGDRLEVIVKGYGAAEESWLIAWSQLHGDPGREEVWRELDAFLARKWEHVSGQTMKIECAVIDSGGMHTEQVYRYVKVRQNRKVFAIRGGSKMGAPLVSRPSTANRYQLKLFTLGVGAGKDMVMARLHIKRPGPGFIHLPAWVDDEYLAQLTSERALRKYVKGVGAVREWVKTRDRNEAWDLEVYALAGLHIMGPLLVRSLAERAARYAVPANAAERAPDDAALPSAQRAQRPRRKGWVAGW